MEVSLLLTIVLGSLVFVGGLVAIYAGIRRMQGHPSRFDRFFEAFFRTQSAGVYPPSLRGNPDPQIQSDVETSRGDRATREAPGDTSGAGGRIRPGG